MQVKQFVKQGSEVVVSIIGIDAYLEQTLVKQGYEGSVVDTTPMDSSETIDGSMVSSQVKPVARRTSRRSSPSITDKVNGDNEIVDSSINETSDVTGDVNVGNTSAIVE